MNEDLTAIKRIIDKLDIDMNEKQTILQLVHNVQKKIKVAEFKADRVAKDKTSLLTLLNRTSEDLEQALRQVEAEQEVSERLLLNILPEPIAARLKQGEHTIADSFSEVSLLFVDIAEFTPLAAEMTPAELVFLLSRIFSAFDQLARKYGLEKIKTIGDAYMVAGGIPTPRPDHAEAIAEMALDIQEIISHFKSKENEPLRVRVGIHTGPVVAGVIGIYKFSYDLWGDTVSIASRMEKQGICGCIQVTMATYERLKYKYLFEERGRIWIKGKGDMTTYFLTGRKVPTFSQKSHLMSSSV
jgi:class 3 adenylate cyclase